jgi:hypothetical protein
MPQAPTDGVFGGTGNQWNRLEGTELRAATTVLLPLPHSITGDRYSTTVTFTDPLPEEISMIPMSHYGAQVWIKVESTEPVYGIGSDNAYTKFAWDGVDTISITAVHIAVSAGVSNDNLLHNGDFRGANTNPLLSTVPNQRGLLTYSGTNIYTIDRWLTFGNAEISINTLGGITIISPTGNTGIRQRLEPALSQALAGKVLTYSVLLQDGTLHAFTFTMGQVGANVWSFIEHVDNVLFGVISYDNTDVHEFQIRPQLTGQSLSVQAVKLERGPVSTLLNDSIPEFGDTLLTCMRFQQVLNARVRAMAISANMIDFEITLPVLLRGNPIVNLGEFTISQYPSWHVTETGFSFETVGVAREFIRIRATKTAHGLTDAFLRSSWPITLVDANL